MINKENVSALSQFLDKVQLAKSYNTKELRLPIIEAEQLSINISKILLTQNELANHVIVLQKRIIELQEITSNETLIEVSNDGGKF